MSKQYIVLLFNAKTKRGAGLLPVGGRNPEEAKRMTQIVVGDGYIIDEVIPRKAYEKRITKFAIGKFIADAMWTGKWLGGQRE